MIELSFTAREADIPQWQAIFTGLADEQCGSVFQDRMEVFGEAVDSYLEELMDDYEPTAFIVDGWENNNARFSAEFEFPEVDPEFTEALVALFKLCPVSEVSVKEIEY